MTIPQMAALARDHIKTMNPELYQLLQENGELQKETEAAAKLTQMEMNTLMKGGPRNRRHGKQAETCSYFAPKRICRICCTTTRNNGQRKHSQVAGG